MSVFSTKIVYDRIGMSPSMKKNLKIVWGVVILSLVLIGGGVGKYLNRNRAVAPADSGKETAAPKESAGKGRGSSGSEFFKTLDFASKNQSSPFQDLEGKKQVEKKEEACVPDVTECPRDYACGFINDRCGTAISCGS